MLSPEALERIRRMTPGERLALGVALTETAWGFMKHLPREERERRLRLRREPWNPPVAPPSAAPDKPRESPPQ